MKFKETEDGYLDTETNLIWQKEQCADRFNIYDAIEYCETLGCGYRLPTIKELTSIIDYESRNPASDLPGMMSSNYWSATTLSNNINLAWLVYFNYGDVYYNYKSSKYYVRAIKDYFF